VLGIGKWGLDIDLFQVLDLGVVILCFSSFTETSFFLEGEQEGRVDETPC
jgi:hypothetical protein